MLYDKIRFWVWLALAAINGVLIAVDLRLGMKVSVLVFTVGMFVWSMLMANYYGGKAWPNETWSEDKENDR